jgi:pilus assembly protein Flp/PilA
MTDTITRVWRHGGAALCARLSPGEDGASLVEYALLVALIAVVCIVAILFLGTSTSSKFSNVGSLVNG